MTDTTPDAAFDAAVITAAFAMAAARGWRGMSLGEAAREAGLDLARARTRFPGRGHVLLRFGTMADRAALDHPPTDPDARERLFDIVMRRIDVLQAHRDGVLALMRHLPTDPALSLLMVGANLRSMGWLLNAAGIPATGIPGALRVNGLLAVWLYVLRAWKDDESADLPATMAALDRALNRAVEAEQWLPSGGIAVEDTGTDMETSDGADVDDTAGLSSSGRSAAELPTAEGGA